MTATSDGHRGWKRYRWIILRRCVQLAVVGLFLLGPLYEIWWAKGNLASSLWLDTIPLSDPFIMAQSWLALGSITQTALLGAVIVVVFYTLVGGRVFCSWVCPINVVTDAAHWCRQKLRLPPGWRPQRQLRHWLLLMSLIVSAMTGSIVWELVNPVTMVHRAFVFGIGAAWAIIAAVFLFDMLVSRRGWCGHLCPVGAFYGILGRASLVRVSASDREACTDCGDCFEVCPEPQVIAPALHGKLGDTRVITDGDCTNCGRCIDVCPDDVFRFGLRNNQPGPQAKPTQG